MANSRNNRPTTSPINSSGISTAIREKVREIRVKPICCEPFRAASIGGSPSSSRREIFSTTTIASSITNPVAIVRAISDRLFRLKPSRYITPKVPTSDNGTATLGIRVADRLRRNRKVTITTRATDNRSSNCTSAIEARMVRVRSETTDSVTPSGNAACSDGSCFLILSTT